MQKRKNQYSDFWGKYKHPKWQKRRLEILQLNEFKCSICLETERELNVHHIVYIKGRDPWQYNDDQLECLCDLCHRKREADLANWKRVISENPSEFALMLDYLARGDSDSAAFELLHLMVLDSNRHGKKMSVYGIGDTKFVRNNLRKELYA